MPPINKAVRAAAIACNAALLFLAGADVLHVRLRDAGGVLEILFGVLVFVTPVISLVSWVMPPLPSEERQLRAAIRVAELRSRLRQLDDESREARSGPSGCS